MKVTGRHRIHNLNKRLTAIYRARGIALFVGGALFILVVTAVSLSVRTNSALAFDWRDDWEIQSGFTAEIDAQGFQFPTSIAFVPNPGSAPKDPLYFVAELAGTLKVVTNDRSVFTFATDFFRRTPNRFVPVIDDEVGLAGVCLDPVHGYVFATFAYHDLDNIQRNNIVRFQSEPETFSLTPTAQIEFTEMFARFESIPSHQIGPCQVKDDLLYVNVADANQVWESQQLESVLGKVLRLTLDGKPAPNNPFYQDDDIHNPANFVWSYGLRNPFGLEIVDDRVFIADNGPDVDRFFEVTEGSNNLWDGSNNSIGTNAAVLLSPGRGVAQIDYYSGDSAVFPARFQSSFFLTVTASPSRHREGIPAIIFLRYDLERSRVLSVPAPLLRYRGSNVQVIAALAFGPDGLYFAPLFPNENGISPIIRLKYQPDADYPFVLGLGLSPVVLMDTYGCFACHTLNNNQGGDIGPVLDRNLLVPRLESRLNSQEYADRLRELDSLDQEPLSSFKDARTAVEQAEGIEKIRLWLRYRIQNPRFDDPNARMPVLGLSDKQAGSIADYLTGQNDQSAGEQTAGKRFHRKIIDWTKDRLPIATRANAEKFLAAFFGIGLFAGVAGAIGINWVVLRVRRGRQR